VETGSIPKAEIRRGSSASNPRAWRRLARYGIHFVFVPSHRLLARRWNSFSLYRLFIPAYGQSAIIAPTLLDPASVAIKVYNDTDTFTNSSGRMRFDKKLMRISPKPPDTYPWYLRPFFWNQRRKYGAVLDSALLWARTPKVFL
jgi:hypothetical protein